MVTSTESQRTKILIILGDSARMRTKTEVYEIFEKSILNIKLFNPQLVEKHIDVLHLELFEIFQNLDDLQF